MIDSLGEKYLEAINNTTKLKISVMLNLNSENFSISLL